MVARSSLKYPRRGPQGRENRFRRLADSESRSVLLLTRRTGLEVWLAPWRLDYRLPRRRSRPRSGGSSCTGPRSEAAQLTLDGGFGQSPPAATLRGSTATPAAEQEAELLAAGDALGGLQTELNLPQDGEDLPDIAAMLLQGGTAGVSSRRASVWLHEGLRDGVEAPIVAADAPRPVRRPREHRRRRVTGGRMLDRAAKAG